MGKFCSKRRTETDLDWEVVDLPEPAAAIVAKFIAKPKLYNVVKRICRLLKLRILWARLGQYLQAQGSKSDRQLVTLRSTWGQLGIWLRRYSQIFSHLVRREGVLNYVKQK
jgi:steroid 5-alpha reductase family enzyme